MGYVLVGVLVIVVLAAAALLLRGVLKATDASAPFAPEEDGAGDSPAGDSTEHAGEQEDGRTVTATDAEHRGGTGGPTSGPNAVGRAPGQQDTEPEGRRYKRDNIGGEGEAETTAVVDDHGHGGAALDHADDQEPTR